jgi:hypothetical protein
MKRRIALLAIALPVLGLAQGRPNLLERLQRMSPAERARFLDRIPPDRRLELERRLRQIDQIPPDVRDRLKREYDEFQQLPPERQQAVRRISKEINELEPRRRGAVRGALHFLRQQSPTVREERMNSRPFKNRFSEAEQRLLREALEVLPPLAQEAAPPSEEKL